MPVGPEVRDAEVYRLVVLPGAPDQLVSCTSDAPTLPNFANISEGFSDKLELEFPINSDEAAIGIHYITFTATNDDPEPLTSTYVLQVEKTGTSNTGIAQGSGLDAIRLVPNPAVESSSLTWPADLLVRSIVVLGTDGRVVGTFSPTAMQQRMTLDLEDLAPGNYMVRATTGQGVWTERLVKTPR